MKTFYECIEEAKLETSDYDVPKFLEKPQDDDKIIYYMLKKFNEK